MVDRDSNSSSSAHSGLPVESDTTWSGSAFRSMMNRIVVEYLGSADSMYDARFMHVMIPHNAGAVFLGAEANERAKRPELRDLGYSILRSQQGEIRTMLEWLERWYGQTNHDFPTMPADAEKVMTEVECSIEE